MSSSSSIRKPSISSFASADDIPLDTPPAYHARPAPTPACCRSPTTSQRFNAATQYPPSSPGRPVFLAARLLTAVFALTLFILAFPAERARPKRSWMSAVMSPSINAFIAASLDAFFVLVRNVRSHPLQRLLWDGAIACGFAVSAGFMVKMTAGDILRTDPTSSALTAGLGASMLFLLFSIMIMQFGIAYGGGRQWFRLRRERKAAAAPAAVV